MAPPDLSRFATVDWSYWPVIVITYPNIASVEGVERLFAEVGSRAPDKPFAIVGDLRGLHLSTANAKVRAAFAKNAASDESGYIRAEAAVLSSTVARGMVTAYRWISPARHPIRVFEDVAGAIVWARGVLDAEMAAIGGPSQ